MSFSKGGRGGGGTVEPERVALGLALGAHAARAAHASLAAVEEFRTARTNVERKFDTLVFASLVIARWLVTGEAASREEMAWLGRVGEVSVADGTRLAVTTRGTLAWRDYLLRALRDEGRRLGSPRGLVAEAMEVVGQSCDANLVRASGAYDEKMLELNAAVGHQALHDDLTGLPNRRLLLNRLASEVELAALQGTSVGVLMLDLDRFKVINDTLGHDAGDHLLSSFAVRVRQAVRSSDTIARLGGDEFAILPSGTETVPDLVRTAEKVLRAARSPFSVAGHRVRVQPSIGIAMFPDHGSDAGSLLRCADLAMYAAKDVSSGYAVFTRDRAATAVAG
ncbi:MAG: hypothetical protein QOE92_1593 [Chloroflexota bacterium]|nr:hypothetical protein [Chloroflexota bacterium]